MKLLDLHGELKAFWCEHYRSSLSTRTFVIKLPLFRLGLTFINGSFFSLCKPCFCSDEEGIIAFIRQISVVLIEQRCEAALRG